jgi:hypothetical protein
MSTIRTNKALMILVAGTAVGIAAWISPVAAADVPGSMPGDEKLTCDQIYQQGMAESQRNQQEIAKRSAQMKAQNAGTAALVTSALLTGGATGPAAQAAAEAQADSTMAQLGRGPQVNVRSQRLRQLYAEKKCQVSSAPTSDDAMTCEQIAGELAPYAQQMMPSLQAMGASQQQVYAQGRVIGERQRAEETAINSMATASVLDKTGISNKIYAAAVIAQHAKEKAENEAFKNSPTYQQNKANTEQFMAQGEALQSDGHVQHLMQLAQAKHCDKR